MAPPEHILLGISIANIYQSLQSFLKRDLSTYRMLIFFSIIFALLPDIDSFTRNYASTNILTGHRGITHSLFFVILSSLFFTLHILLFKRIPLADSFTLKNKYGLFIFSLLFSSALSHIIADLPQPASIWGGIPFFFPLKVNGEYARSGGWGKIGWYDIKIIWYLIYAALISGVLLIIMHVLKKRKHQLAGRAAAITVLMVNLITYTNIILYISNSTYSSNEDWNIKQKQYIEDASPLVRSITNSGKTIVLKLFYLIRH